MNDAIERLIGFSTHSRPFESWYAFVSRLICANLMTPGEANSILPTSWIDAAYDPFNAHLCHLSGRRSLGLNDGNPAASAKVVATDWMPLPTLSSAPPECLRGCPTCLAHGYHSYATQGDLITHCPVHHEPLTHRCPHCDRPLFWRGVGGSPLAFRCPQGCSLASTAAPGLILPDANALEAAWKVHYLATAAMKNALQFVSGPVHLAYPPLSGELCSREPALPTPGAVRALYDAVSDLGVAAPRMPSGFSQSDSAWRFQITPWTGTLVNSPAFIDRMLLGFRRGPYRTVIPVTQSALVGRWLETSVPLREGVSVSSENEMHWLTLPSHLIVKPELMALRRVLAQSREQPHAYMHYGALIETILARASERRNALDAWPTPAKILRMSDYVDGIFVARGLAWRAQGTVFAEQARTHAWRDYRELAELGDQFIHITHREDVF